MFWKLKQIVGSKTTRERKPYISIPWKFVLMERRRELRKNCYFAFYLFYWKQNFTDFIFTVNATCVSLNRHAPFSFFPFYQYYSPVYLINYICFIYIYVYFYEFFLLFFFSIFFIFMLMITDQSVIPKICQKCCKA